MATNRDKKTGMAYKARKRNVQRRMEEWEASLQNEQQPSVSDVDTHRPVPVPEPEIEHEYADAFAPEHDRDTASDPESDNDAPSAYRIADEDGVASSDDELETLPQDPYEEETLEGGLQLWAFETGQSLANVTKLLRHLRKHAPYSGLPSDARTLLKPVVPLSTEREITTIAGGTLWYHGIEACLQSYFRYVPPADTGLSLDFFVDGLPLYKTSRTQFWPILLRAHNLPDSPVMTIAIFCGESKPGSVEEFLRPYVTELNILQTEGVKIGEKLYWVRLRAIIADSPARSFIKGMKQYNVLYGCHKCTIRTECEEGSSRRYYRYGANAQPRTHAQLKAGAYPLHVKNHSPLYDLINCDMIFDVLVAERMHLIDHGVLQKLVLLWIEGFGDINCRMSWRHRRDVDDHIVRLKLPSGFRRKLRDLRYANLWKAYECKMFLMIVGFVVLKGRLREPMYNHFMLLFVAITLLSTSYFSTRWQYADQLLKKFVADYATIYAQELVNSNVHNLLHVHGEVCRFGDLSTISAYPFESKLGDIKRMVHSGRNSLSQAAHRLMGLQRVEFARQRHVKHDSQPTVSMLGRHTEAIIRPGFILRNNFRDQWFMTTDGTIIMFQGAALLENGVNVQGFRFSEQSSSFTFPCDSREINMFTAHMDNLERDSLMNYTTDKLLCKLNAVKTRRREQYSFVPLVHTYPQTAVTVP